MLVLGRNDSEQIRIGEDIVITVIKSRNGHTRLGIEAPREVPVLRGELESPPVATAEGEP